MTETSPVPSSTTSTRSPSGVTATASGSAPEGRLMVEMTTLLVVSMLSFCITETEWPP
jgi:hypothetical protein